MRKNDFLWMMLFMSWLLPQPLRAGDMNLIITLGRADLQRHVEQLFPFTRKDNLASVRLYDPEVILNEGNDRIGLRLQLHATAAEQLSVSGFVRVDGLLRFKSKSGEFYLDDTRVEELKLNGLPTSIQGQIHQVADASVRELLRDRPIYVLGQMGEAKQIMGSDIKSVSVHNGTLLIELAMP